MQEIPKYKCWLDEGLIPSDAGTGCLRALVAELNSRDHGNLDCYTDNMLRIYAIYSKAAATTLRCCVGGCEARVEMNPELYELLSERS